MEDEALAVLATGVVVEELLLVGRSQRADAHRLRFTAGEDGGAVDAGQRVGFGEQRTEVADLAAVGTHALFHDGNAESLLLDVFEHLLDVEVGGLRVAGLDRGFHFVAEGADLLATLDLGRGVDGILDAAAGDLVADFKELFLGHGHRVVALRLAGQADQFFLGFDQRGHRALGEVEGLDEVFFGDLVGGAFDHDDVGLVADVDQVEVAVLAVFEHRVDDEFTVDAADAHRTDRAGEGNVGDGEGGGGAVHREDVGVVDLVGGEEQRDDLGFVKVALREQGAQRTVGHAAGQDFLFGRASFALEVAARELAGGGGFFLVLDGKREPGLAGFHFRGGHGGHEDHGFAGGHHDGTIGELGDFTRFEGNGVRADLARDFVDVHLFYLSVWVPPATCRRRC